MNKLPVRLGTQLNISTASGLARCKSTFATGGSVNGIPIAVTGVAATVPQNVPLSLPNKSSALRKMPLRQSFGTVRTHSATYIFVVSGKALFFGL